MTQGQLPDLTKFVPALQAQAETYAVRAADAVRAVAPRRTGNLAASLHGIADATGDGFTVQVLSEIDYARYVIDGTAPHPIDPVAKKALFWEGAEHPVRHVNHPGTTADPFGEDAAGALVDLLVPLVQTALEATL